MAIHYDARLKRFRDDSGKLVSRDRAWRSSVARAEFAKAQKVSRAKPKAPVKKPTPKKPAPPKAAERLAPSKAAKKSAPKRAPPPKLVKQSKKQRVFPWEVSGVIREYPEPQEWFPDFEEPDYDYDYDDLSDDWGDFEDEDTTS